MGPATTERKIHRTRESRYDRTKSIGRLWDAWAAVYGNAVSSTSAQTRAEAKEYAARARVNISRIARKLAANEFTFAPQKGVLIAKKAKGSKRPVVIAPIDSRIVQRAILDSLQEIPGIRSSLKRGLNFGGVLGEGFGVPGAVLKTLEAIQSKPYFIRTDIKSFFMRIPREAAVNVILAHISDVKFEQLVRDAVETEIADAQAYGEDIKLFPIADEGVAQGSCLSPLLCNLLLDEFDLKMNNRGIVTIRYIDDFLILAKDKKTAFAAFKSARTILANLGLDAYDPELPVDKGKAEHGQVQGGIQFLGCEVRRDRVRPSRDNWRGLIIKLNEIFWESLRAMKRPDEVHRKRLSYAETTLRASRTVQGWANTFGFCTDDQLMESVDVEVTNAFNDYNRRVKTAIAQQSALDQRKSLGLFSTRDRVAPPERDKARAIIAAGSKQGA